MFQETNAALDLGVIFDSQDCIEGTGEQTHVSFLTLVLRLALSLGLIIIMLSLLALLMSSLLKFKE